MIGPYLVACGLLVVAGISKVTRPANTVRALSSVLAFPRVVPVAVPILAGAEMVLGAAAMVWPIPVLAAFVAGSYACFAGVVVFIRLHHGALSTCGCFGTPDTPATWLHALINVFLAISCAVIAIQAPGGSLGSILRSEPLHGLPLLLGVAVGMYLVFLAFTSLAQLTAIRHTVSGDVGASST